MLALNCLKIQTEMSLSSSHLNYCWCSSNFTLKMWNFYYFKCYSFESIQLTFEQYRFEVGVSTCTWIFFSIVNTTALRCSWLIESMDMEPDMSDHKLYMNFQLGGRSVPLILTLFMGQLYTEYQSTLIWKLLTIPECHESLCIWHN